MTSDIEIIEENGGRGWDRTSDPYDVNVWGCKETQENQGDSKPRSGNSGTMFCLCSRLLVRLNQRALRKQVRDADMTREEAIKRLKECQEIGDTERAHALADVVLCELLTALGYSDVIREYAEVDKWYA